MSQLKTKSQKFDQPFQHRFDNSVTKRFAEIFGQLFVKVFLWSQNTELTHSFQP